MKVYIKNGQKLIKVNQRSIAGLLRKALRQLNLPKAEVSILFVSDRRMRILNRQYRGVDKTTDVLSFPQVADFSLHESRFTRHDFVLGDIVISLQKAKRQAEEDGFTLNEEVNRLLIHGLLHLIGYDHETNSYQKKKMKKKETELLGGS